MPSAKLRQIYATMLQLRSLRTGASSIFGLEACLISPTVDLKSDDLVWDAADGPHLDIVRDGKRNAGAVSEGAVPTRLTVPLSGPDRLWAAVGSAVSLRAASVRTGAAEGSVLLCFAHARDAATTEWARVLQCIARNRLPLLFVLLPAKSRQASSVGGMARLAVRYRIPGMPVDQHDAVALYRVAQEAINHARIDGGGALIECVRYSVRGRRNEIADPIEELGRFILSRKAADTRWLATQQRRFTR